MQKKGFNFSDVMPSPIEVQKRIKRLSETQQNVMLLILEEMEQDNRRMYLARLQARRACKKLFNI
jgi:hypothetical protein